MGLTLTTPSDGSCLRELHRKELEYDVAIFLLTKEVSMEPPEATGDRELSRKQQAHRYRAKAAKMRGNKHASK